MYVCAIEIWHYEVLFGIRSKITINITIRYDLVIIPYPHTIPLLEKHILSTPYTRIISLSTYHTHHLINNYQKPYVESSLLDNVDPLQSISYQDGPQTQPYMQQHWKAC